MHINRSNLAPSPVASTRLLSLPTLASMTTPSKRPSSPSTDPSKKPRTTMSVAGPSFTSQLLIKKLAPNAILPTRGSAFAAGLDLYSCVPLQRS